jgi:hypothetical protein
MLATLHASQIVLISCALLLLTAHLAEASARADNRGERAQAARHLAYSYLQRWSAPNRVALSSASSFYSSTILFHGRRRSLGSVLLEKRRFTSRWPDRSYQYSPTTTQVACEVSGVRCTVWSVFEFSARNSVQGQRSRGTGEHELVVSFASGRPVIVSENSRVLRRGRTPHP